MFPEPVKLLITRPDHDSTVEYLYYFSEVILAEATAKGLAFTDLAQKQATKANFLKALKGNPMLVIVNGHGDPSTITGYNNEPLITQYQNEADLKGTITYARSCQSGKKLGPDAVKFGKAKAYIGYDEDFVFMYDENAVGDLLSDTIAARFLTPSNQVALSLLSGKTVGVADTDAKALFQAQIDELSSSDASPADQDMLPFLYWDKTHQVVFGDPSATIN